MSSLAVTVACAAGAAERERRQQRRDHATADTATRASCHCSSCDPFSPEYRYPGAAPRRSGIGAGAGAHLTSIECRADERRRSPRGSGWVVGVSRSTWRPSLVYVLLGTLHEIPLVFPDELIYGHLARSVADGDGITLVRRRPSRGRRRSTSTCWRRAGSSPPASGAYALAKVTGALARLRRRLPCLAARARGCCPDAWRAAVPTVLSVAGKLDAQLRRTADREPRVPTLDCGARAAP